MCNDLGTKAHRNFHIFVPTGLLEIMQNKKRILVFTDSRGQHKPAGSQHDIFTEKLAKDPRFSVDAYLCPMKWTTTLDFLEFFQPEKLGLYDHVILYTGIVDWSPRPHASAQNELYDNKSQANLGNLALNTRDYSKKIINNKKRIFDEVFSEQKMKLHFAHPYDTVYEGQRTINMYSMAMAAEFLIPIISTIPNLIFINANRFSPGWEGDFRRRRPSNITITEKYSDLFSEALSREGVQLIDLREWTSDDIRLYTCDNIHLTEQGSNFIYERLIEVMSKNSQMTGHRRIEFEFPDYSFSGFAAIERLVGSKRARIMNSANCTDRYLATLIIGVRDNRDKPERLENLKFLLRWIDFYYGDLFDVLLVEQDAEQRIDLCTLDAKPYVRHVFLYNPNDYNRGWAYNVAVRQHCEDAQVVALMDTDVLTGSNFVRDIIDCHGKIDAASPYLNIYYTNTQESDEIKSRMSLSHLTNPSNIKNPVTVSGGIVIMKRAIFMAIKGFEQYIGYSCEDRAMDVTIFNHVDKSKIRISPYTYVHLYHDTDVASRSRFKEIYAHLQTNYGCNYDKTIEPFEFIHKNCAHVSRGKSLSSMLERTADFGDPLLYRRGEELTINGTRPKQIKTSNCEALFPPDFKDLSNYTEREVYASAPTHDSEELDQFYNRFKGERCFIIGNGPSLNNNDLALLSGEFSFGVNSFYYKTRETGFRPYFYVVEDSSVMKENISEIRAYEAPFKFFPTIYKNLHPKGPNTFFFNMNRGFYEKSSPNYAVPRFSTDASKVLYCGQSVTYINLQLAFFMGFTEVYLIGMDFDYVIPETHKRTGDVLLSDTDDPNHFHKDYFGKGKTWKDPKLDRVAMNYRQAKLVYESVGRRIYNATVGGKLEIFPRVDYEALLRDPQTGLKRSAPIAPTIVSAGETDSSVSDPARQRQHSVLRRDSPSAAASPLDLSQTAAEDLLLSLSTELLSNRNSSLDRLSSDAQLKKGVELALAVLPRDHKIVTHFHEVRSYVATST